MITLRSNNQWNPLEDSVINLEAAAKASAEEAEIEIAALRKEIDLMKHNSGVWRY